jgi:carbohydrate-selective porin OprB
LKRAHGMLLCALQGLAAPALADDSGTANPAVTTAVVYDGAVFTGLAGGLSRASTYTGNLNARATLDLDKLIGWKATTFYADALWIHGGQPSSFVGDAQGISTLSAPSAVPLEGPDRRSFRVPRSERVLRTSRTRAWSSVPRSWMACL